MIKQNHDPVKHLKQADPILNRVIERVRQPVWELRTDYFQSLVRQIINQQLSDTVADILIARFTKLFKKHPYTPDDLLKLHDDTIRGVGISYGKAAYMKDLAQKVKANVLNFETIHTLTDEEVITHLVQVKGIGRWTAEMFLMFSLGREDVFSYGDQGLKNAMKRLYKLRSHPTLKQAEKITAKWKPYRSWGCRYLWASLDIVV